MTAPTREQCEAWARSIEGVRVFDMGGSIFGKPEYLQRFAALAFAAGAASRPVPTGADLLTEEECNDFQRAVRLGEPANNVLQAAARIGAERERERAAKLVDPADDDDAPWRSGWVRKKAMNDVLRLRAAAIRRGEGS